MGIEKQITEEERRRIVKFLWAVYEQSTHGASNLMERAIRAVQNNEMNDPAAVANPDNSSRVGEVVKAVIDHVDNCEPIRIY